MHRRKDKKDNTIISLRSTKKKDNEQGSIKKKKGKKMKRLFMSVIVMLSMTMAFAENEENESVNEASRYEFNVNMNQLSYALELSCDQREFVTDVMYAFGNDMQIAAYASADERKSLMEKAINRNLAATRMVMSKSQYRKYLMLLNATLHNRGLLK